jgi:YggT family protein
MGTKNMQPIYDILNLFLSVALTIILIHAIMSWLINFQVLNLRQPIVAQIWYGLNRLLDPLYDKVRRFLPSTPGLDFAPLVIILLIYVLQIILPSNASIFN